MYEVCERVGEGVWDRVDSVSCCAYVYDQQQRNASITDRLAECQTISSWTKYNRKREKTNKNKQLPNYSITSDADEAARMTNKQQ